MFRREDHYRSRLVLIVLLLFHLGVGIWLFITGFFPPRLSLEGFATQEDYHNAFTKELQQNLRNIDMRFPPHRPIFGKLIFMVVDALRADFISGNESRMHFTRHLLSTGQAIGFISYAQSPTVTLPRIKALTSGMIPNFLDFLFNFRGAKLEYDNFVTQFYKQEKRILFYGDETWLKLFPGQFLKKSEGTTSFFVSDTVEVDENVTRHLEMEFEMERNHTMNTWDVLILHYLGLDHVGHSSGPRSILMGPKQVEMDNVVNFIFRKILEYDKKQKRISGDDHLPTLFVLCSDHGMNELGNHGGSSQPESSSILVFMSSLFVCPGSNETDNSTMKSFCKTKDESIISGENSNKISWLPKALRLGDFFQSREVFQVDLVPTISILFSTPIPRNNLGILIPELLWQCFVSASSFGSLPKEFSSELESFLLGSSLLNARQQIRLLKSNPTFWLDKERKIPTTSSIRSLLASFDSAEAFHKAFLQSNNAEDAEHAFVLYQKFLIEIQREWMKTFNAYDVYYLGCSILVFALAVAMSWMLFLEGKPISLSGIIHLDFLLRFAIIGLAISLLHEGFLCRRIFSSDSALCSRHFENQLESEQNGISAFLGLSVFLQVWISFIFALLLPWLWSCCLSLFKAMFSLAISFFDFRLPTLLAILENSSSPFWWFEQWFLIVGGFLHLVSLAGSSTIEEEHQTWYFLATTLYFISFLSRMGFLGWGSHLDTISASLEFPTDAARSVQRKQAGQRSRNIFFYFLLLVFSNRIMRGWNQTGNKYLGFADYAKWLSEENHTWLFYILVTLSIMAPVLVSLVVARNNIRNHLEDRKEFGLLGVFQVCAFLSGFLLLLYKFDFHLIRNVLLARALFLLFSTMAVISLMYTIRSIRNVYLYSSVNNSLEATASRLAKTTDICIKGVGLFFLCWWMFLLLLHRIHNAILFPFMLLQMFSFIQIHCGVTDLRGLWKYNIPNESDRKFGEDDSPNTKSSLCLAYVGLLWMGQTFYFAFGNSNSVATIDINGAYTGLDIYHEQIVGGFTFLITFSGPFLCFFGSFLVLLLYERDALNSRETHTSLLKSRLEQDGLSMCFLMLSIRSSSLFVFSIVVTFLRHHLFIWSVFSPKLIYEILFTCFDTLKCLIILISIGLHKWIVVQ